MAKNRRIEVTPLLNVAGAYLAGDEVGVPFEIPGVVDYPGKGGSVVGVTLVDKAAQALAIDLILFNALPIGVADNAIYDVTDAEAGTIVGQVSLLAGDYIGGASNKTAHKDTDIDFETTSVATSLWGIFVTRGIPTYALNSLVLVLEVIQEDDFAH